MVLTLSKLLQNGLSDSFFVSAGVLCISGWHRQALELCIWAAVAVFHSWGPGAQHGKSQPASLL